jgi:hypothetical protein
MSLVANRDEVALTASLAAFPSLCTAQSKAPVIRACDFFDSTVWPKLGSAGFQPAGLPPSAKQKALVILRARILRPKDLNPCVLSVSDRYAGRWVPHPRFLRVGLGAAFVAPPSEAGR